MAKAFDWKVSLALDKAIVNRDNAKTKVSYIYYNWLVHRLEKKIPAVKQ